MPRKDCNPKNFQNTFLLIFTEFSVDNVDKEKQKNTLSVKVEVVQNNLQRWRHST